MSRWFRVYDSLVDDPKVQRLAPDQFKALVNLWCLACRNGGELPPLADIAFSFRMPLAKVERLIADLKAVGLIDHDADADTNHPHNWSGRQFQSDGSTPRVKRFRKRFKDAPRNVSSAVSVTPPDTETDSVPKGTGETSSPPKPNSVLPEPPNPEKHLFDRGKAVLGKSSGGLVSKLLKHCDGSTAKATTIIEQASQKAVPLEWLAAVLRAPAGVQVFSDGTWSRYAGAGPVDA